MCTNQERQAGLQPAQPPKLPKDPLDRGRDDDECAFAIVFARVWGELSAVRSSLLASAATST